MRWKHPTLGMVSPGRFIPLAEESGLIITLGNWAIREACRQAMAWQRAGLPPLTVAVNLSGCQFQQSNFTAVVADALAENANVEKALYPFRADHPQVELARKHPERQVVFFAIGFETTTPPTAVAICLALSMTAASAFCAVAVLPACTASA